MDTITALKKRVADLEEIISLWKKPDAEKARNIRVRNGRTGLPMTTLNTMRAKHMAKHELMAMLLAEAKEDLREYIEKSSENG